MINNQAAPQAFMWVFGVALNEAAAGSCLAQLYNNQPCDSSQVSLAWLT